MNQINSNKENRHPNKIRVQEDDINKISKQYVLEGERLKVKSIFQWDNVRPRKEESPEKEQKEQEQGFQEQDYTKLEYLEKLGVLNQEEQKTLSQMRSMKPNKMNSWDGSQEQRFPLTPKGDYYGYPQQQQKFSPKGYNYPPQSYNQTSSYGQMSYQQSPSYPFEHSTPEYDPQTSNYYNSNQSNYY